MDDIVTECGYFPASDRQCTGCAREFLSRRSDGAAIASVGVWPVGSTMPWRHRVLTCFLVLHCVGWSSNDSIDVKRFTIDGGGITTVGSGGSIELSGTIGQPDAGVSTGSDLTLSGGFWFSIASGNCLGNIVASAPANGLVDAGQPHPVDNVNPQQGWNSVTIIFDNSAAGCDVADFVVTVTPNDVPVPTIFSAVPIGNSITIIFDSPIPSGHWTRIVHNDASPTSICLGFLPGDVNGDRYIGPLDILRLVDALNNVGAPLPMSATDVNRSGEANSGDIITEIDLFNGAGEFEVWYDRALPNSPCDP